MRLIAYIIDSVVVFVALLIVRLLMAGVSLMLEGTFLGGEILFQYTLKDIVLYLAKAAYFVMFTYFTGTTLGKRTMNLCVISADSGKLQLFDVVYRETVGRFLSAFVINIGYLMVGVDKEKRGLHDILCDTRVVYVTPGRPAAEAEREEVLREVELEEAVRENVAREEMPREEAVRENVAQEETVARPQTFQEGKYIYRSIPPKQEGGSMETSIEHEL